VPVIFFSVIFYTLALMTIFVQPRKYRFNGNNKELPFVTIQLPVYNDPVVVRCIKSCLKFDYPKNRYEILVADDSTDKKTKRIIDEFSRNFYRKVSSKEHSDVKVFRRDSRKGFKPGALNNLLNHSRGEIIVIFDSDFTPKKNFLKRIIQPFLEDKNVACVQSRMGYLNSHQNRITKLASTFLMMYHNCIIPINDKLGVVFFCGTGGAIRKDVLIKLGGWNERSITEDSDLSIKMFRAGYKNVYLADLRASGELPFTLKSFIRQQMRWAYGNTRVFIENAKDIWLSKTFSFRQRLMMTFVTTGNLACFFVVMMTFFGLLSWITGTSHPVSNYDARRFVFTFIATGGFLSLAFIGMVREKKLNLMWSFFVSSLTIGLVVALTNAIAVMEAMLGKKRGWFRTPKYGSISVLKLFDSYLKRLVND